MKVQAFAFIPKELLGHVLLFFLFSFHVYSKLQFGLRKFKPLPLFQKIAHACFVILSFFFPCIFKAAIWGCKRSTKPSGKNEQRIIIEAQLLHKGEWCFVSCGRLVCDVNVKQQRKKNTFNYNMLSFKTHLLIVVAINRSASNNNCNYLGIYWACANSFDQFELFVIFHFC